MVRKPRRSVDVVDVLISETGCAQDSIPGLCLRQALAPTRKQVLALLAIVLLVYLPTVGNGFPMDDQPLAESLQREHGPAVTDPVVGEWHSPLFYFQHHYWYPHQAKGELYRPVTVWSFALTYNLVGRLLPSSWEAFPHHLINVLLHVWATWLVLQMVLALRVETRAALLTTILFGLHAIHSEVVASIVGRAELFAFCFGAQAVLWFVAGGAWRCVGAAILLFLAACSKESAVAWFPFLPCYLLARAFMRDPTLGTGQVLRADLGRLLPVLLVPLLAWALARWSVVGGSGVNVAFSMNELAFESPETRILTAVKIWGYGLYKCLAPFSLACIYSAVVFPLVKTPLDIGFLASASALLVFLVLGLRYARRAPLLFLAMAVFLGFSFITSNVPVAIGTVFGERLYYTPSLGVCLLPAWLLLRLPRLQPWLMLLLLIWTATCCAVIWQRNFVWENDKTLFRHDVEKQRQSIDLHRKAADTFMSGEEKDLDKAMALLEAAVKLDRRYPLAWLDMGGIQMERRNWKAAIQNYNRVLESPYVGPSGAAPLAHINIGKCWLELGDKGKAVAALEEVLRLVPAHREAWQLLAGSAAGVLPRPRVQELFDRGLRLFPPQPNNVEVMLYLGGMGYQGDLEAHRVAEVLSWAIRSLPPNLCSSHNAFIAKLYYANTLERLQRNDMAVGVYRDVANDRACPEDLRAKARQRLDALQKRR